MSGSLVRMRDSDNWGGVLAAKFVTHFVVGVVEGLILRFFHCYFQLLHINIGLCANFQLDCVTFRFWWGGAWAWSKG